MSEGRTFGTDVSSRIVLGVIFGFFVALGIGAALDGDYIVGPAMAVVGFGVWLHYATLRVTVTERVVVRRYGIVIFTAPRLSVSATVGRGGELGTHTALILEASGQKRVQLLRTLFGRERLAELAEMLGVKEEIQGGVF